MNYRFARAYQERLFNLPSVSEQLLGLLVFLTAIGIALKLTPFASAIIRSGGTNAVPK